MPSGNILVSGRPECLPIPMYFALPLNDGCRGRLCSASRAASLCDVPVMFTVSIFPILVLTPAPVSSDIIVAMMASNKGCLGLSDLTGHMGQKSPHTICHDGGASAPLAATVSMLARLSSEMPARFELNLFTTTPSLLRDPLRVSRPGTQCGFSLCQSQLVNDYFFLSLGCETLRVRVPLFRPPKTWIPNLDPLLFAFPLFFPCRCSVPFALLCFVTRSLCVVWA